MKIKLRNDTNNNISIHIKDNELDIHISKRKSEVGEDNISEYNKFITTRKVTSSELLHGKRVQGGIAIGPYPFVDDKVGYIVVAPSSQRHDSNSIQWCTIDDKINGLASNIKPSWIDPHTGITNTHHLTVNRSGGRSFPAATYCNNLSFEGCDDYFLPNKNELKYIYNQRDVINSVDETGNLNTSGIWYWSSSEYFISHAWRIRFSDGFITYNNKNSTHALVPVRRILI